MLIYRKTYGTVARPTDGDMSIELESSDRDVPDEVVTIRIHMKSDPAAMRTGENENAIRQWEKLRTFKFNRVSSVLCGDFQQG